MSDLTREQIIRIEIADRRYIRAKKIYIDMVNNLAAGVVLSEIVYWHLPGKGGKSRLRQIEGQAEKWLACRRQQWWERSRLTAREFDRALDKLVKAKLVIKDLFDYRGQKTLHVRINWGVFTEAYNKALEGQGRTKRKIAMPGLAAVWDILLALVSPNGEVDGVSPNGNTLSPDGNTDSPNGETVSPNGETIYTTIDTTQKTTIADDSFPTGENQNSSTLVIQGIPVKPLYIIQGMPVDDNPLPPDVQFFKHPDTGVTYEFPRNQWGESVPMKNPSIPTGDKLNTLKLDLAAASFFGMAYPPAANRWSYLKLMTNFFTGRIEADAKKKKQSEWYEYQFTDDPFTADEIMAMLFWWEDATTDDMKLQKPSTIAEKVVLFRLSENYEDYLKNARYAIETRLNELYPPIMPVKTLASPEEIAAVFDFTPRR